MAEFSLGEAQLGTSVDLSGLKSGIAEGKAEAQSGFGQIGNVIGGVLKVGVAAAAAGAVAAGAIVAGGIADARDAALVMAQTEAVIKSTGGAAGRSAQQVSDLAASLSAAAGKSLFGDDDIQQSENLLLTFTGIKGEVLDASTAISVDMAQALGGLPKDQAIQLGKALNDPVEGFTKLQKIGVTFTDEQIALGKAMVANGDVAGAQKIILEELNKEFGGSAEAAAKADGGWAQFKDRLGEAQESIGTALLPLLTQLVGFLNDSIAPAVESAAEWFGNFVQTVQIGAMWTGHLGEVITTALTPVLGPELAGIIGGAVDLFGTLSGTVSTVIATISGAFSGGELSGALSQTGIDFGNILTTVQGVMDGLVAVVSAVLAQLSAFWAAHGAEITAFAQQAWSQIADIINTGVQLYQAIVPPVLQAIAGFINAHGAEIQLIFSGVWQAIQALISGTLATIQGIINAALAVVRGDWEGAWVAIQGVASAQLNAIQGVITGILNAIAGIFGTTLGDIKSTWEGNWNQLVSIATTLTGNLVDVIMGLPGQVAGVGAAVVDAIRSGIEAAWGSLVAWFEGKLEELRNKLPFSEPKDTSSPLYGLSRAGEGIILQILEGMDDKIPELINAIVGAGEQIENEVERIADQVRDTLAGAFDATASLDRQRAKMLDEVTKFTGNLRASVDAELAKLEEEAAKIEDPEEAAKFYQMRSRQILEMAKLQEKLNGDLSDYDRKQVEQQLANIQQIMDTEDLSADEKKRLQEQAAALQEKLDGDLSEEERKRLLEQMDLIRKAQQAEQDAFKTRQEGLSDTEKLAQNINDLMTSLTAEAAEIEQKLKDRNLSDEERRTLTARLDAIRGAQAALAPIATAGAGLPAPGGGVIIPPPAPMPAGGTGFVGPGGGAGGEMVVRVVMDAGEFRKVFKVEVDKIGRLADARRRTVG